MSYWTALAIIQQASAELGLVKPASLVSTTEDVSTVQLLALMNSAGNELLVNYPWEQFTEFHQFLTVNGQAAYDLPVDWIYYVNQTQWDNTNHWPLLGPKSPQEWAWITNSSIATAPRTRYRVFKNKLNLFPVPGSTPFDVSIEYIKKNWVTKVDTTAIDMAAADGDTINYDPWLVITFMKLKFYELKSFDTTALRTDFMRRFMTLTGKDKGAPKLSLSPSQSPILIGPWSVPDGSWQVT